MATQRTWASGRRAIGSFPSVKIGAMVPFWSEIERDLLYFFEYDAEVRSYEARPIRLTARLGDGRLQHYAPAFLTTHTTGHVLVDCLPAARLGIEQTQRELLLGQRWAEANGCEFVVITDQALRSTPCLANLKLLWRYSRLVADERAAARCLARVSLAQGSVSILQLATALADGLPPHTQFPLIYSLLFRQVLEADLTRPLTPSSHIHQPKAYPSTEEGGHNGPAAIRRQQAIRMV